MIIEQEFPSGMKAIYKYDIITGQRNVFKLIDEFGNILIREYNVNALQIYSMIAPMCEKCMPKKWERWDGKITKAMLFIIGIKAKIRDGKRCKQCGAKNNLVAHHIKKQSEYPELRFELDNIITLCSDCEKILHALPLVCLS